MAVRVVRDNRAAILARYQRQAEQAVAKAALDTEAEAKIAAPVDTGFLRNSIQATQQGKARWRVAVGASYGRFIEFGTYRMAARPFLLPAFRRQAVALRDALKRIQAR